MFRLFFRVKGRKNAKSSCATKCASWDGASRCCKVTRLERGRERNSRRATRATRATKETKATKMMLSCSCLYRIAQLASSISYP